MEKPLSVRIFIGPFGLRAGWRLLLFLLVLIGISLPMGPLQGLLARGIDHDLAYAIDSAVGLLTVFAATWVMARLERKPLLSFGLGAIHRGRNLGAGIIAGFAGLSLLIFILWAAGACRFASPALHGPAAAGWGLYWAMQFVLVGFVEEMTARGYPQFALSQGIGFWPAAIVLSVLFGAGHLGNGGEQILGIANAMLAGLVFAFTLWWSGSLWWAIGCHMSWDWGQTFFYGVADSGTTVRHHLLSAAPAGPSWLSGGSVGPEGSVLAAAILLLLAVIARFTLPRVRVEGLERLRNANAGRPSGTPPEASAPSISPSMYSAGSDDTN